MTRLIKIRVWYYSNVKCDIFFEAGICNEKRKYQIYNKIPIHIMDDLKLVSRQGNMVYIIIFSTSFATKFVGIGSSRKLNSTDLEIRM